MGKIKIKRTEILNPEKLRHIFLDVGLNEIRMVDIVNKYAVANLFIRKGYKAEAIWIIGNPGKYTDLLLSDSLKNIVGA